MRLPKFTPTAVILSLIVIQLLASGLYALDLNIISRIKSYWPEMYIFVEVTDSSGAAITGLTDENFEVMENSVLADYDVTPFILDGSHYSLVLDCSGSMSGYQNDVVYAGTTFVGGMNTLDAAAVIFFGYFSDTRTVQAMTNNHDLLIDAILDYYTNGSTALWYGYYLGLQAVQEYLPPRILLGFTDGQDNASGSYTIDDVLFLANITGTAVYSIGLGSVYAPPLIQVAEATGGSYVSTVPDSLWWYYNQIQEKYQNLYEVAYFCPDPTPDGQTRYTDVIVNYDGSSASDTLIYPAPWVLDFAPQITLTPYTTDTIFVNPQTQNQSFTVKAWVTDNDVLTSVLIKHRPIGETFYNSAVMERVSDSLYAHTFNDFYVQPPGIEFYILANDSYYNSTTSPQQNPGYYPYQVGVTPNALPVITHTPVQNWPEVTAMPVSCEIVDVTTIVDHAILYYRTGAELFWTEAEMVNTGGDTWEATVPAEYLIASDDLSYMIRAWDDQSSFGTEGPHFVFVGTMPIGITLTPESLPIEIPASGGSFNYNIAVINAESTQQNFDVWCTVTLPSGTEYGPVLGPANVTLPGNITVDRDRTQNVPGNAPAGSYVYNGYVGVYPDDIWASDNFPFEKLTTDDGVTVNDWFNWGQSIDNLLDTNGDLPGTFTLLGAYPNPFNPSTTIRFGLAESSIVKTTIYDTRGRLITSLADREFNAGYHEITFDATDLPSGIYLYRIETATNNASGKMVLIK